MEEKLRDLKQKKARMFAEIESLASCSDLMYTNFGRVQAQIMLLEKQLFREVKNDLTNEN